MATRKRPSSGTAASDGPSGTTSKKRATAKRASKKAPAKAQADSSAAPDAIVKPSPTPEPDPTWLTAVRAAESKKAEQIRVLDLREVTAFADFFVICSGGNPKQVQAIAEEIDLQLGVRGEHATSLEGFKNAEWILADYGDMIVHVFSEKARDYYQLERLWNQAVELEIPSA